MFHLLFYIFTAKKREGEKKGEILDSGQFYWKDSLKKRYNLLISELQGGGWVGLQLLYLHGWHLFQHNISPHRSKMVLTETKKSHHRGHYWDNNFKRLMLSIKGQKCHCSCLALKKIFHPWYHFKSPYCTAVWKSTPMPSNMTWKHCISRLFALNPSIAVSTWWHQHIPAFYEEGLHKLNKLEQQTKAKGKTCSTRCEQACQQVVDRVLCKTGLETVYLLNRAR